MANPNAIAPDEDALDRETIGDREDSLMTLYRGLRRGSESAAQTAAAIGQIIGERMVHCASRNDIEGLTRWHRTCQELIAKIGAEE